MPRGAPSPSGLAALSASPIVAVGVHDGLSAALAERAGLKALWLSSFCVTAARAVPDNSILSSRQLVDKVQEIRSATALQLIADIDEGHGGSANAARLAHDVFEAGAWAISIEDNAIPKVNSFRTSLPHRLVSVEKFQSKLCAVRQAAPSLKIIARTEALIAGNTLTEAIARGNAYAAAGADYVLIHSRFRAFAEFASIAASWLSLTPLAVIPTLATAIPAEQFASLGFVLVVYANQAFRSAAASMMRVYESIAAGTRPYALQDGMSMEFLFDVADRCQERRERQTSLSA